MAEVTQPARTATIAGGNLFAVAGLYLADATQAIRLAQLNGMADFWFSGVTTLAIPPTDLTQTGGVPPQ